MAVIAAKYPTPLACACGLTLAQANSLCHLSIPTCYLVKVANLYQPPAP